MGRHKKIESKPENKPEEPKRKINFRMVGNAEEIIDFRDFRDLTAAMHNYGWDLTFQKTKAEGWWIEFRKI